MRYLKQFFILMKVLTILVKAAVISGSIFGVLPTVAAQSQNELAVNELGRLLDRASQFAVNCGTMQPAQCDSALIYAIQGLHLAESGSVNITPARTVSIYAFVGDIFHRQRKFDKAIAYLNRGIHFADSTTGRNIKEISDCFFFLGLIEEFKQAYGKAIQYHQNCLGIRERLTPPSPADLAKSHQRLGACYGNIKDREREKQHLDFARWICEQNPDISPGICNSIVIDLVASSAGAGEFNAAVDLAERLLGNPALSPEQQSSTWFKLANIYHKRGELEMASKAYQRHIEIVERIKGPYDSWLTWAYSDWGQAQEQQGDTTSAIRCYRKVAEITRHNFKSHYGIGAAEYRVASLRFRFQNYEAALYDAQQALVSLSPGFNGTDIFAHPPLDNSINYDYFRRALWLKARILTELAHKTGDTTYLLNSRATYRHCLALVDRFRDDLPTIGAQTSDLAEIHHIYEEAINIELEVTGSKKGGAPESAFAVNEKSKSFLLYAGIRESQAIHFDQIPEEIRAKESNLRQQISQLENKRNTETGKGKKGDDPAMIELMSKLFDVRRAYESLIKIIENQYPEYYRLKHDLQVESVSNVQQNLLQPDQALLEYFVGDSSIFIFLVKKDDYRVIEVKKDFPLENRVQQLRHGIYGYHTNPKRTDKLRDSCIAAYIQSATALYQKLLAPVDSLLPRRVIIVPDGALGYIPFEALLTANPERMDRFHTYPYFGRQKGREHSISYCYSATLLREMTTHQHRREPSQSFLAYAPYFDGDTTLLASRYIDPANPANRLPLLKYAAEEVEALHNLMGGKAVIGRSARKDSLIQEAGRYRIVHLSTHGKANDKVGDYSFLAFSEVKDGVENEWLYVRDIYNLSLNADLVVLSACETGIGELKRGEGIISLARAFAYAGAKSIVTTLWSVDDAKTKDFMVFFYRNLKEGMTKDEALAKARSDYFTRYKNEHAHPYFWAGFIGIGDMRE